MDFQMKEIILDTETTGLDPKSGHRIIEIGALEMYDKVLTGRKFHCYINPERDVPQEAYRIHGISSDFLLDKPLFEHIAAEMLEFIADGALVIHNSSFDMKFLNYELSKIGMASLDHYRVIDTLPMARKMFPGAKVNLDALCTKFKIDNSLRTFHGALKDAKLLADVYVELCGGRQAKFETKVVASESHAASEHMERKHIVTKIVKPTDLELKLHEEFMEKI